MSMPLFYCLFMTDLLILSLAVWRITSLLTNEYGPWHVLESMRRWVGVSYDENLQRTGSNVVAEALTCMWCTSVWIGLIVGILYGLWPVVTIMVAVPFAVMGGALVVNRIVGNG